ncbi:MAG: hypothetical protein WC007_06420, partial [Pelobacteraceae bacterium]
MMKSVFYTTATALLLLTVSGCVSVQGLNDAKPNLASYHYQMGLSYLGERNYTSALIDLTEAE